MSDRKTFENSYGDYPFAELVRLSLVLAGYARRLRDRERAPLSGEPARV